MKKWTSLEYSYRSAVSPGKSFQDFIREVPYQLLDQSIGLKHSEFKKPYAADSYQAMEYQSDIPSPFYPAKYPGFPDYEQYSPQRRAIPTGKKTVIESIRKRTLLYPPFTFPPFRSMLNGPPKPGNKPGVRKEFIQPTMERRQPSSGSSGGASSGGFNVFDEGAVKVKPLPGGSYSRTYSGSSYTYGDLFYDGCKETTIPVRTSQRVAGVSLPNAQNVPAGMGVTINRQEIKINADQNPGPPVEVNVDMSDSAGNIITKTMTIYPKASSYPCSTCGGESIGFVSQQMAANDIQGLTVVGGGSGVYTWAVTAGGGTIDADGVYTAPATNPECANNPTITLSCNGTPVATFSGAVNASADNSWQAFYTCCDFFCKVVGTVCTGGVPENNLCFNEGHCNGSLVLTTNTICNTECGANSGHWSLGTCASIGATPGTTDHRTAALKTAGCCPAQLL